MQVCVEKSLNYAVKLLTLTRDLELERALGPLISTRKKKHKTNNKNNYNLLKHYAYKILVVP